jgi:hypothetical protein
LESLKNGKETHMADRADNSDFLFSDS